jgi:ABC-type multidrug transport system permease subunit
LEGLPGWVGWATWFLPLTHAVILMRGLTSGGLALSMWVDVAWLAAFTVLAFWFAVRLIRKRLIR